MANQHDTTTTRRNEQEAGNYFRKSMNEEDDASSWESDLHPSSTAPSTDESSFSHEEVDLGEASSSEDEEECDGTHDMEQLQVALEFTCSIEDIPGEDEEEDYCSVEDDAGFISDSDCEEEDDHTVDSLILTRRRFAKNHREGTVKDRIPRIKMMKRVDGDEETFAPFPASPLDLKALLQTKEQLVKFTRNSERRRRTVQKHDSLKLTRKRHPGLIHAFEGEENQAAIAAFSTSAAAEAASLEEYTNNYLKRRVRRLMRTKDSLELARERFPHLIHTRNDQEEECIEDEDDDLSLAEEDDDQLDCFDEKQLDELYYHECDSELDDEEEEWDSDFDPFEDDLDSIFVNKERLSKRKKQSTQEETPVTPTQPKDDQRRLKDMHYGRMGLCSSLLQSAEPNTCGTNCAA